MNTPAFPGYPIEVVDRVSVPKHHLLYPIRVLYSGEIIIDRPFESTHPIHRSQVVNLDDVLEE